MRTGTLEYQLNVHENREAAGQAAGTPAIYTPPLREARPVCQRP